MVLSEFPTEATREANARDRASVRRPARLEDVAGFHVVVLCLLAFCVVAAFFYWVAVQVTFPYELNYGEGIVLWQAQHVSHLSTAYASLQHYPYVVFHYPPLYQLVSLAMSKLTGDLLVAGRLVSAISFFGICLTLAWVVYRTVPKSASKLAVISGTILAGAAPCCLPAMRWAPLMRVDLLGLWFTFAGLVVFILARTSAQRYCAFVLFVASMYTRQTFVAGAVACLLVAFLMNRREAVKLMAFTAVLGATIMAALVLATHGEVIRHLFLYNVNRFTSHLAIIRLRSNFLSVSMIMIAAIGVAAAFGPVRDAVRALSRRNAAALRSHLAASRYHFALFVFTAYFILACLMSISAGKSGSDINYFLEMDLGACALASLFISRLLWKRRPKRASFKIALGYILPVLFVGFPAMEVCPLIYQTNGKREMRAEGARNSAALVQILSRSPEPVMSEDMTLLFKAGKQVPFEPAIVTELAATHAWDETPLVNLIRDQRFSVMIIGRDTLVRYSPAVLNAIRENYQPTETYAEFSGYFTVYVPSTHAPH